MKRRGFLKSLFGGAAVVAIQPQFPVKLLTEVTAPIAATTTRATSGINVASMSKALWPGINAWYDKEYGDG